MDERYIELMNRVLVSNYWGEVVVAGVLSELLDKPQPAHVEAAFQRLLGDERRHAELVRGLLMERGVDPLENGQASSFAYRTLFEEYAQRPEHRLAFLTEFELMSGPTFGGLVRVAKHVQDEPLIGVYARILRDEGTHGRLLKDCLGDDPLAASSRQQARERMKRTMNWDYMRLYMAHPSAGAAKQP